MYNNFIPYQTSQTNRINDAFFSNDLNQDERVFGGFLGPFILGGITGGLVAPYFTGNNYNYNRPPYYNNNYYYPPYYYGPYYY